MLRPSIFFPLKILEFVFVFFPFCLAYSLAKIISQSPSDPATPINELVREQERKREQ